MGVVGAVAWAIQVVEPFCKVDGGTIIIVVPLPMGLVGLEGLVFACYKAPVEATDIFKIEKREVIKDGVACASCKPFCVDYGSVEFFKVLYNAHVLVVS